MEKGALAGALFRKVRKNRDQPACKPGSVWRACAHVAAIHLGRRLPGASSSQPGRRPEDRAFRKDAVPIRLCSRWGLPCRSRCRSRGGLLPHRFTLARARAGGLISVALSLGSPPPDVIRHRVSVEPGLSSTLARRGRPAGWWRTNGRRRPPRQGALRRFPEQDARGSGHGASSGWTCPRPHPRARGGNGAGRRAPQLPSLRHKCR